MSISINTHNNLITTEPIDNDYSSIGIIGEGAYGIVIKGKSINNGEYVAIKQLIINRDNSIGIGLDGYREINLLSEYNSHPNIIRLLKVYLNPVKRYISIIYNYCDYDLTEIIRYHRNTGKPLDQLQIKSILYSLLSAVSYLHLNWIMHRDIKPANILLSINPNNNTNYGRVQLADFGLARIFQSPIRRLSDDGEVVTIWYRAPELLLGSKHYTKAIDIWAIGCIFYELISSLPLFNGEELKSTTANTAHNNNNNNNPNAANGGNSKTSIFQENQFRKIIELLGRPSSKDWSEIIHCPHYNQMNELFSNYPLTNNNPNQKLLHRHIPAIPAETFIKSDSNAFNLLKSLLIYDPNKRITADEALKHPYFTVELPKSTNNPFSKMDGSIAQYKQREVKPFKSSNNNSNSSSSNSKRNRDNNTTTTTTAAAAAATATATASGSGSVRESITNNNSSKLPNSNSSAVIVQVSSLESTTVAPLSVSVSASITASASASASTKRSRPI